MAPPKWTLDQRSVLHLLKTRFELTNDEVRTIIYRMFGTVLAAEGRNYTAQNLEDEVRVLTVSTSTYTY